MTNEEIKQNAEAYADENKQYLSRTLEDGGYEHATDWQDLNEAYIEGAHSRDEEIMELNEQLETCRKTLLQCVGRIIEVETENNQLRNPWISVEDRLPKKTDVYYVRTRQGCADMAYFDSSIEKWEKGRFTNGTVTNWMPIPELPKGGAQ